MLKDALWLLRGGLTVRRTAFYTRGAAAAAAKSLQSCPTLCDPIDGSPPGSPIPGILQARILEWVAISQGALRSYKSGNEYVKAVYCHPAYLTYM